MGDGRKNNFVVFFYIPHLHQLPTPQNGYQKDGQDG